MRHVLAMVPVLAACGHVEESRHFACKTTDDCVSGQICSAQGYCSVLPVDAATALDGAAA